MRMHEDFVLDTSVLTNPDAWRVFGNTPEKAVEGLVERLSRARCRCFMPRSVYQELLRVRDLGELAAAFELQVKIRSPRRSALQVPAELFYAFIEEVRQRIDRGLRIAEEHARQGLVRSPEDEAVLIHRLRERYREALRQGLIDSREDADVLLLAYELDAAIVSADQGLCAWADRAGVSFVSPERFCEMLDHLSD